MAWQTHQQRRLNNTIVASLLWPQAAVVARARAVFDTIGALIAQAQPRLTAYQRHRGDASEIADGVLKRRPSAGENMRLIAPS